MAKVTIKQKASSTANKPAKLRVPRKPKALNAPKVANKVKPPMPEQEVREKQIKKDNAPLIKKMEAFIQRPPPRYMTQAQFERKKELVEDKAILLANIKDAEERLEALMDPIRILKNEIGEYKSTLNYNGKELKCFFGMREPVEGREAEELEAAGREIASLLEEASKEEPN